MISDDSLYRLALYLGFAAMLGIVLHHFLEVNAKNDAVSTKDTKQIATPGKQSAGTR